MKSPISPAEGAIAPLTATLSGTGQAGQSADGGGQQRALLAPLSTTLPVGGQTGPLAARVEKWRACAPHPWVMSTVTRGYRLQFASKPPPFNGIVPSVATGESALVLESEIATLLAKGAIRKVPEADSQCGFYSRYFVIPKRGGGLRPILDLRVLNSRLRYYKFRMLTNKALLHSIQPLDWFTSIDLQDAYFHISIIPAHRRFLRFAYNGVAYEYQTVPFGLSVAPRLFTKCVESALHPLRMKGIRVLAYIDDYLLCAPSQELAVKHTETLSTHLTELGFKINQAKSSLVPAQSIEYLGLRLDSVTSRATLSERRVTKFRDCLSRFRPGAKVSFRVCLGLLGIMASTTAVVPLGLLMMRDFQAWVNGLRLCPRRHLSRQVRISRKCMVALEPWRNRSLFHQGSPMGAILTRKVVSTDASLWGWGGVFEGRGVNGEWSPLLRQSHINYLELLAVFLTLRRFLPYLQGQHVLVRTDNTTTVAYINRQGGVRSMTLCALARRLLLWSSQHLASLRAVHVPGRRNWGPDLLSRGQPQYGEWCLHPQVATQLWEKFGRASVDLFASRENALCPLFFSLTSDAPLGIDALAHPWPNELLYAFPPIALITQVLARVREGGLSMILIAPHWPGRPWVAEISQLLSGKPWELPLRRDLVSQAHGQVFHPHPDRLALWAWPVQGKIGAIEIT